MSFPPVEQIPSPPPGPGVRAPFAAPPTERDRKRMWIGLGIGAALLVVCCGGGIAGFVALVVAQNRAIPAEATAVVDRYLSAIEHHDYPAAYDLVCATHHSHESLAVFTARKSGQPELLSWQIDPPRIFGSEVLVPVLIDDSSGFSHQEFTLVQDDQAGGLRICGGE